MTYNIKLSHALAISFYFPSLILFIFLHLQSSHSNWPKKKKKKDDGGGSGEIDSSREKKCRINIWERIRGNTKEESNAFQNQTSDEKH